MKPIIIIVICSAFFGCKSTDYKKIVYTDIPIELQFLSNFRTKLVTNKDEKIIYYEEIKLKEIIRDSFSEFWNRKNKLISIPINTNGNCFIKEVFKKNFLLITNGSCGAAAPDLVVRNKVILIDLNSHKKYKINFGKFKLTRSKKAVDEFYINSDIFYSIVDVDIEKNVIRINNNKIRIKTIEMFEEK